MAAHVATRQLARPEGDGRYHLIPGWPGVGLVGPQISLDAICAQPGVRPWEQGGTLSTLVQTQGAQG